MNRISSYIGFTISRSRAHPYGRAKASLKTLPVYIEFLGVPGIGKTTLFKKLMQRQDRNWIDSESFVVQNSGKNNDKLIETIPYYQSLAENKMIRILEKDYKPTDKLKVLHYFYTVLVKDAIIHGHNKQNTVISDEGLLHNFGNEMWGLHEKDKALFLSVLRDKAVIYCYASADIAMERVLKRYEETGYLLPQFKVDSPQKLLEVQKRSLLKKWEFLQLIKEYIPVLLINTEKDLQQNMEKMKAFIKGLQENK